MRWRCMVVLGALLSACGPATEVNRGVAVDHAPLRPSTQPADDSPEGLGDGSCGPTVPIGPVFWARHPGPCTDDFGGARVTYTYDSQGRVTSRWLSNGGPSEIWTYDDRGRTVAYDRSTSDHFESDRWNYVGDLLMSFRIENEYSAGTVTFAYDPLGHLSRRITDRSFGEHRDEVFTLNARGQPTHEDETITRTWTTGGVIHQDWRYDPSGNVLLHTATDEAGALASIETWTYDLAGHVLTYDSADGAGKSLGSENWSYDTAGHPWTHAKFDADGVKVLDERWTYDAAGLVALHELVGDGRFQMREREEYLGGRQVRRYSAFPGHIEDHHLSYCANGNLKRDQDFGSQPSTLEYSYTDLNEVAVIDRFPPKGPFTSDVFSYDSRGNVLSEQSNAATHGRTFSPVHNYGYACFANEELRPRTRLLPGALQVDVR